MSDGPLDYYAGIIDYLRRTFIPSELVVIFAAMFPAPEWHDTRGYFMTGEWGASPGKDEMIKKITLPVPPSVNRYWRNIVVRNSPRTLISEEGRAYKQEVHYACIGAIPFTGPVKVEYTIYRPRKIGDLDNYLKSLLDALKGIAFIDDDQVVELHGYRADDKDYPRVEVTITEVTR